MLTLVTIYNGYYLQKQYVKLFPPMNILVEDMVTIPLQN